MRQTRTKIHQRQNRTHSEFVSRLSTILLHPLLEELGNPNAEIKTVFVEPKIIGRYDELDTFSPDMVVFYASRGQDALLLLEAKGTKHIMTFDSLERQLSKLKGEVTRDGKLDADLEYFLMQSQIPKEALDSCTVQIAGVYRTKSGNFRIYARERIR